MLFSRKLTKFITLSFITATALHATNGDHLIAVGAKARGMGGTSIGISHGAESGLNNPSLITSVKGTEIGFGGTVFMPTIETGFGNSVVNQSATLTTSDAKLSVMPEISIAHKINENWFIGIGMWGTAGMGVDYSQSGTDAMGNNINMHMVTSLQLMQFGVPIAYKTGGLSVGITPILQYGNLDINYDGAFATGGNATTNTLPTGSNPAKNGAGLAQKLAFGYNLGISYNLSAYGIDGLTIGAIYKSSIEMEYKGQLSSAMAGFGVNGFSDILEQPAEIGVGFSYVSGQHTIAFDYKKIKWGSAKGYKDFGWTDQDVYAVGYKYTQNNWSASLGYNYGKTPISEGTNPTYNTLNLLGFPATAEQHYTIGGSYSFTKAFSVDLSYVYAPKTSQTFDISAFQGLSNWNPDSITTDHTESSVSFQLVYKF